MRVMPLAAAIAIALGACVQRPRTTPVSSSQGSVITPSGVTRGGEQCTAARAAAQQRADSALAVPATLWRPSAADDTTRIEKARQSGVIAQVVVDTLGAPVMRTFRVLAAQYPQFGEVAAQMLEPMRFPPAVAEGCTVPAALVIPFEFTLR